MTTTLFRLFSCRRPHLRHLTSIGTVRSSPASFVQAAFCTPSAPRVRSSLFLHRSMQVRLYLLTDPVPSSPHFPHTMDPNWCWIPVLAMSYLQCFHSVLLLLRSWSCSGLGRSLTGLLLCLYRLSFPASYLVPFPTPITSPVH